MTRPLVTRSHKLPRAPPKTRESAIAVALSALPFFHSRAETTANAASENIMSMAGFHSEGDSANRPKAAPWFCTCVSRNLPGSTSMLSWRVIFCDTSHFVIRSQRTTRAAIVMWYFRIVSIRCSLLRGDSPAASLAYKFFFDLRQRRVASLAHRGVAFIFTHAGGVIPAALTLLPGRFLY